MRKGSRTGKEEMRSEYKRSDFGTLVRGKYVERLRKGSNVVVLDPRVTKMFPTAESVNSALLSLVEVARRSARLTRGSSGRAKARRSTA